jgi:hypothetical protein
MFDGEMVRWFGATCREESGEWRVRFGRNEEVWEVVKALMMLDIEFW